jgi:hypothetical protein
MIRTTDNAIDATPQERSEGIYQTGPAPLVAIKDGVKDVQYDLEFIYSEVNADENYYVENNDGAGYTLVRTVTNSIGKNISTKATGSKQRHDITLEYKYPEGSMEERASHGATDNKTGDVVVHWEVDDQAALGKVVPAKLILETQPGLTRTAQVQLVVSVSATYTGKLHKTLTQQQKSIVVTGGNPTSLVFNLSPDLYEKNLQVDSNFIFKAFVEVDTKQTSLVLREFNFHNFGLQIVLPNELIVVGSQSYVIISFTNPLSFPLTKLILHVEGQGLVKPQKFSFEHLNQGETLSQTVALSVLEKGPHLLIALIDSNELGNVRGHADIMVQ